MSETNYERYLVREPLYEAGTDVVNRQSPTMTYMSTSQVPEANYYIELGWIYGMPEPNPHINEHVHDFDEIVLHWGGNSDVPQDLGGEIEIYVGGQPITFNTTTAIFLPKGTPHGPLTWKKFRFPHVEMAIMLGTGDYARGWRESGISDSKQELPQKKDKFDYEQYVVRSPIREAGPSIAKWRQSPTMTYMSSLQVRDAGCYLEFGWIYDMHGSNSPGIPEMVHDNFDEIVLHIGGDPENPVDLGGEIEFCVGGQPFTLNTTNTVFIPKGLRHGPITWKEFRKPHIEMAIMLGAGTWKEGWGDSLGGTPRSEK